SSDLYQSNQVMFNALDTHDTARILTLCRGNKELEKQVLAFMFTQIGAPCIYYGTEVGMDGAPDPDCRKCMVWDEEQQDKEMLQFVHSLVDMRHQYPQLWSKGSLKFEKTAEQSDLIVLKREYQNVQVVAVFNTGTQPQSVTVTDNARVISQQNITKDGQINPDGFLIIRNN